MDFFKFLEALKKPKKGFEPPIYKSPTLTDGTPNQPDHWKEIYHRAATLDFSKRRHTLWTLNLN